MLNTRKLTIALAAGALTMFGATGALAAEGDNPGGAPAEESNPLCAGTPLATTPICASPSQPPGEGGGGGGGGGDTGPGGGSGGGSPSAAPADEGGGANPVCLLMPTDPSCQPSQGPGSGDGGGDTQPSPGGPGGGGGSPSA